MEECGTINEFDPTGNLSLSKDYPAKYQIFGELTISVDRYCTLVMSSRVCRRNIYLNPALIIYIYSNPGKVVFS